MTSVAFDTLKYANRLKTAGVPPAQAEAEAEALAEAMDVQARAIHSEIKRERHEMATAHKRDLSDSEAHNDKVLARLEAKVDKGFAEVRGEFVRIEAKMDKGLAEVRGEFVRIEAKMDKGLAEVRGELDKHSAEVKGELMLLKWMVGVIVTGIIALVAKAFF
ncbi:DUF1640 domain-containing protein [Ralstonia syzygii]|uniref:DUF1640 domain-containing protein n=1 Tax=Ralstonia syzygii TaxID=28097 RepID=UPI0018D07B94|nr:DUF1640 domain-containing protein [Ralstonia syzygii]